MTQLSFTVTIEFENGVAVFNRKNLTLLIEEFDSSLRDKLLSRQDLSLFCSHCPKQLPKNYDSVEFLCVECTELGYSGNVDRIMRNEAIKLFAELQEQEYETKQLRR